MFSGPLSKDSIVIKEEENGKFVLTINRVRFGSFHLKSNAEKFGKFLKNNPQYIVLDPEERKSCKDLRIRIFGSQSNFGCFKKAHIDSMKTFLSENIIPSENDAAIHKSTGGGGGGGAPARTTRTSGSGGSDGGRSSGGGGGTQARTSSGSGAPKRKSSGRGSGGDAPKRKSSDSGESSGGVGEQLFNMRVSSQDQKPQQGLLPQYFRGFLEPFETGQKQRVKKQQGGEEDRYFS
jgi:hypothetical protein